MAPEVGLEPTTSRLTAARSTIELLWNPIVCWNSFATRRSSRPIGTLPLSCSGNQRRGSLSVGCPLVNPQKPQKPGWQRAGGVQIMANGPIVECSRKQPTFLERKGQVHETSSSKEQSDWELSLIGYRMSKKYGLTGYATINKLRMVQCVCPAAEVGI